MTTTERSRNCGRPWSWAGWTTSEWSSITWSFLQTWLLRNSCLLYVWVSFISSMLVFERHSSFTLFDVIVLFFVIRQRELSVIWVGQDLSAWWTSWWTSCRPWRPWTWQSSALRLLPTSDSLRQSAIRSQSTRQTMRSWRHSQETSLWRKARSTPSGTAPMRRYPVTGRTITPLPHW